ncbi:LOW QUALITY PROTEIN: uncharacterized protein LOC131010473, partial [Salvia miltiorrhiza]|uniref:LOW QUALITY PROTEIN: uncharacterized protein LOC131010473 n=1 Tax=Salvia miltiorrhiza TaxID=226208 RepID=UPI0025ACE741
ISSIIPKIQSSSLARSLFHRLALCTAVEIRTQKLERITEELIGLNKIERHDYVTLFRHIKMGLNRFGVAASAPATQSPSTAALAAAKEKTTFDVKLEKFEASAKLKVIKEIRSFTDLGLKEANDLVEKTPAVVKKDSGRASSTRCSRRSSTTPSNST